MPRNTELQLHLAKLRKVGTAVGARLDGSDAEVKEEEVDMSGWSEYEKGRFNVTKRMSEIREDLARLPDLEKSGDTHQKTIVSNRVRKNVRTMKVEAMQLKPEAEKAQKLPEYDELIVHMKKTEKLHNQRYRPKNMYDEGDGLSGGGFDSGPGREMRSLQELTDPANPQGDLTESLLDPAEDEEFQQFYQGVRERDQQIDDGLTRVSEGLGRLKENALGIQAELETQNVHIQSMSEKVEAHTQQMQQLNKKLKNTMKEVEKDKYCCYLICLLLVLGVLGVIVTQTDIF